MILVELAGRDETGLRLVAAPGRLPPGGRRAGLLAHAYRLQLIGLSTRIFTGWLEFSADGGAVYAPRTPPEASSRYRARRQTWRRRPTSSDDRAS